MSLHWLLSLRCVWVQVAIGSHESVNQDFIALDVDTSIDTVIGHPHHDKLILVVSAIFAFESVAFGGQLCLGVICVLLVRALALPESTTVQARDRVLLVYQYNITLG